MKKKKEYEILNQMLDDAIAGRFQEDHFDETELSKLQTKLMRFLTASSMSEQKIHGEREKIKETITDISHQTKTPLTNILMYSQLLSELSLPDQAGEYAGEIHLQARKLETLLCSLVKMSRLETGIFQFQKEKISLREAADEAVRIMQPVAKQKQITLETDIEQEIMLLLDKKWIVELLCNLLDNAIKYSDEKKRIWISTFSYELFSAVRIRDEGIGIAQEEIPMVFGRFYRGRNVHDKEGIGVGLYLAREIAEGHGGYIKLSSRQGEGSSFDVFLPNP